MFKTLNDISLNIFLMVLKRFIEFLALLDNGLDYWNYATPIYTLD